MENTESRVTEMVIKIGGKEAYLRDVAEMTEATERLNAELERQCRLLEYISTRKA